MAYKYSVVQLPNGQYRGAVVFQSWKDWFRRRRGYLVWTKKFDGFNQARYKTEHICNRMTFGLDIPPSDL